MNLSTDLQTSNIYLDDNQIEFLNASSFQSILDGENDISLTGKMHSINNVYQYYQ